MAVEVSRNWAAISAADQLGWRARINTAAPVMVGAEKEVPEAVP